MPAKAKPRRIDRARTPDRAPWHASKYVRFGALGIVAAAAAVAIAVAVGNGAELLARATKSGTVTPDRADRAQCVRTEGLVGGLDQPIYWVGPVAGERYELTRTTANDVYVRYLPPGVKAGTQQGEYPLIATYPYKGALAALKAINGRTAAQGRGREGRDRGSRAAKPTNAHVAFPHVNYQIEVYNPSAPAARRLATSAALTPVP